MLKRSQPHFHPRVQAQREKLGQGRAKMQRQHESGSPGLQLGCYFAELLDHVVLEVYSAAVEEHRDPKALAEGTALVAHGGYGRLDLAPFSDMDLMLLHSPAVTPLIQDLAARLVQDLSDVGVDLGFSVRTPAQTLQLAVKDPVIFSSLVESRYAVGHMPLFERYLHQFRRKATRRSSNALVKLLENARIEERLKYGETVYMLEPNVKRSRGGLRDIHLLRWVGFAAYGEPEPQQLHKMGHLSESDYARLRKAHEFLLRLRNELHFQAGRPQDVLNKPEQLRIAEMRGYEGDQGVLPVERFMQEYFEHTTNIRNVVGNFVAAAKWSSPWRTVEHRLRGVFGTSFHDDYIIGRRYISARGAGYDRVKGNLVEVLRLMELSSRLSKRIDHDLWQVIRDSMMAEKIDTVSEEAANLFLSLLGTTGRLGRLLRRLHEVRVLDKLIPGWDHARCLLQFNEYHKYTVDEHSIRAVEGAIQFQRNDGLLGRIYNKIEQKSTLHLALLIHDIGKGFAEDHSEVGRRIARDVARHLRMPERESEQLEFLVHRHLMLNHLAFRRDSSDQSILLEVASEIGSAENLRMLFVLTCADLDAVGPGVLNQWKIDVLSNLYERLSDTLAPSDIVGRWEEDARDRLRQLAQDKPWVMKQIDELIPAYLQSTAPETIVEELERLQSLGPKDVVAWGRYLPNRGVSVYTVGAHEGIAEGIFYRLTGALTSNGLEILFADIYPLGDTLFLDKFYVRDPDHQGEPTRQRFDDIARKLVACLAEEQPDEPKFRRTWNTQRDSATLNPKPTHIRIDNSTSDHCTIVDVFAHDQTGLLYAIAKCLHQQQLSVRVAKIGTYIDQVVDVFYVTDKAGAKILDDLRLAEIRSAIYHAIAAWERDDKD